MADWFLKVKKDFITCFLEKDRWHYILQGLGNTLKIALVAVLLGVAIGTVVAIIRSTYERTPPPCGGAPPASFWGWATPSAGST